MSFAIDFSRPQPRLNVGSNTPLHDRRLRLRATSVRDGSAVIVIVGGEVDVTNGDSWSYLLGKMASAATAPGPFVVDVSNLQFMARGAFDILAREAQRCRRRGFNLCLVSDRPGMARTVAARGLRPVLLIFPTVEAALLRGAAQPCRRQECPPL